MFHVEHFKTLLGMTKQEYSKLLKQFKEEYKSDGLTIPHIIPELGGYYDQKINPWEYWQGDLDAEIMFIGQGFSDKSYLIDNFHNAWDSEKKSPTNIRLIELFKEAGVFCR